MTTVRCGECGGRKSNGDPCRIVTGGGKCAWHDERPENERPGRKTGTPNAGEAKKRTKTGTGHIEVRVGPGEYLIEHRIIAARAVGKPLPSTVQVHHVNGDPTDNRPENLVVCEDAAYHKLLHRRQRALDATGDPDKVKCIICGEWEDPEDIYIHGTSGRHRECHRRRELKRRREKRRQA